MTEYNKFLTNLINLRDSEKIHLLFFFFLNGMDILILKIYGEKRCDIINKEDAIPSRKIRNTF